MNDRNVFQMFKQYENTKYTYTYVYKYHVFMKYWYIYSEFLIVVGTHVLSIETNKSLLIFIQT